MDNQNQKPAEEDPKQEAPAEQAAAVEEPAKEATPQPQPEPKPVKEEKAKEPRPKDDQSVAEKPAPKPVSANLEKIIEQIEKLSVLELSDLVHGLEERFGVSAQAAVVAPVAAAAQGSGEPQEEKTTFNVVLSAAGANKIAVIKAVRELVPTLGLKEAKDLVESAPKPVLESVNKQTAEEAKTKLTAAGGTVELQ